MSSLVSCRDRRALSWTAPSVQFIFPLPHLDSSPSQNTLPPQTSVHFPPVEKGAGHRQQEHFGGVLVRKGPPCTPAPAPLAPDSRRDAGTGIRAARTASGTRPARGSSPSAASAALAKGEGHSASLPAPQGTRQGQQGTASIPNSPSSSALASSLSSPHSPASRLRESAVRARFGPVRPGSARRGQRGLTRRRGSASRGTRGGG